VVEGQPSRVRCVGELRYGELGTDVADEVGHFAQIAWQAMVEK
jgi:hypothetical protein